MKKQNKLSLDEEINKEAEQILKDVENAEELKDLKVSERMERSLFEQIQEYEYEKKHKVVRRGKKKKLFVLALASVLILVFGSVMTSVGSKSYWKVMKEKGTDDGNLSYTDVENMITKDTTDLDEVGVYREINEKLGFSPVRMGFKPPKMFLIEYNIDIVQKKAYLFYQNTQNKNIIRYTIYINDADSSFGQKITDAMLDKYEVINGNYTIDVEEYGMDSAKNKRYIATFEHGGVQYQLKAVMDKEDFDEIIKNLIFL